MSETTPKAVIEMSRAELFAEAKRLGLETTPQMKNTDLVSAIEAAFEAAKSAEVQQAPEAPPAVEDPAAEASVEAPAEAPPAIDPPAEDPAAEEAAAPPEAEATDEAEIKEPVVKSGFLKVKIRDFRGSFLDARFDDNGVCERISEQTLRTLANEFPGMDVVEYKEL